MPSPLPEPDLAVALDSARAQLVLLRAGDLEGYLAAEPAFSGLCAALVEAMAPPLGDLIALVSAIEGELANQAADSRDALARLSATRRSNAAYAHTAQPQPLATASA